jgi:hypothetical protein
MPGVPTTAGRVRFAPLLRGVGSDMKTILFAFMLLGSTVAAVRAESNDSRATMTNAEAAVQAAFDKYSTTHDYKLLLEARAVSSSMNPRARGPVLSEIDERCLRLQLKTLLAAQEARDQKYDPKAPENMVCANVSPPDSGGQPVAAGMDPKAIQDPVARKKYEDAIEANNRKNEKLRRERDLSRCADGAVIDIWSFVRNLPADSEGRKRASQIIDETVTDKTILTRLKSDEHPGLTW